MAAAGDDPATHLEIQIGQLVNLVRDGEPVRMSKRAGNFVLLTDLVEAVGIDAARYALARASVDQQIDIDADLWSRQTNDNPVFYVQYAHARISSVLRNAADLGLSPRRGRRRRRRRARARAGERPAAGDRRVPAGPRPAPPSCGRRTGSPATWRSWPAPTTASTTPAASCRAATRRPTSLTTARLWLCAATATCCATASPCSACSAPERM